MCNMYMRSRSIVIQLRVIQNLKECLTTLKPFCVMCAEYKTKSVGKTYFGAIQSVRQHQIFFWPKKMSSLSLPVKFREAGCNIIVSTNNIAGPWIFQQEKPCKVHSPIQVWCRLIKTDQQYTAVGNAWDNSPQLGLPGYEWRYWEPL